MPFTLGITCYRLPTFTPSAFKDHYETQHVPLITSLIDQDAAPISYKRHYMNRTSEGKPALLAGDAEKADWDCFVEITFRDEEHWKKYMAQYGAKRAVIGEHEATFLDGKRVLVATYETEGL